MSRLVAAMCELFQVTRHHTSSFKPQANSLAERVNGPLAQAIRSYCSVEQTDWHKQLPAIMMAFRNAQSATTGYTPYELEFGRQMKTPLDTALIPGESLTKTAQEHMQELVNSLKLTNVLVKSNRLAAQTRQKHHYDSTAKEPDFHLGQQVMLPKHHIKPGLSKKLTPKYDGPFYIIKVCPNHTFNLRRQSDHKPVKSRIHANRLKPYHNPVLRKYADQVQTVPQPTIEPDQEHERLANDQESEKEIDDEIQHNYFVEKILASTNYRGEKLYQVKWLGLKNTTWERKSTLPENLINEFHIKHTAQGTKREKPLRYFQKSQ